MEEILKNPVPNKNFDDQSQEEEKMYISYEGSEISKVQFRGKSSNIYEFDQKIGLALFSDRLAMVQNQNQENQKEIYISIQNIQSFGKNQNSIIIFLADPEQVQSDSGEDQELDQEQENANNEQEQQENQQQEDEIIEELKTALKGQVIQFVGNYDIEITFQDQQNLNDFKQKLEEVVNEYALQNEEDEENLENTNYNNDFNLGEMVTADDIDDNGVIINKKFNSNLEVNQEEEEEEDEQENSEDNQKQEVPKIINKTIQKKDK